MTDLVKTRGCLKAKLYCKAEGSISKSHTPLPTSPSALLGGKERFLVKPCDGNPEPSTGGAAPASLRVPISTGPCGAAFAHAGAVPGGVGRIHLAPGARRAACPAPAAGRERLSHVPRPHPISQESQLSPKSRRALPAGAPRVPAQRCSPWLTRQAPDARSRASPRPARRPPGALLGGPRLPPRSGQPPAWNPPAGGGCRAAGMP